MKNNAFEKIVNIGEIPELIDVGRKSSLDFAVNLHIHLPPNFSAFNTIDELVEKARTENIKVLGCSNYYDYTIYDIFAEQACDANILPIFGTEILIFVEEFAKRNVRINDPNNVGRMYLCGKGIINFDNLSGKARQILDEIRNNDRTRIREMIKKINRVLSCEGIDISLTEAEIISQIANRCRCSPEIIYLQERHLAQAYQQVIFQQFTDNVNERKKVLAKLISSEIKFDDAIAVQNALRSALMKFGKPAYVEERFVDFNKAVELINELGGIVCYPTLIDGANPVCEFEASVEEYIDNLRNYNITCVEFIPLRNDVELLVEYVRKLDKAGFIVLAGTEHNTPEVVSLIPKCKGGADIPEEIMNIFRKGSAFVAGWQYLAITEANCDELSREKIVSLGIGIIRRFVGR